MHTLFEFLSTFFCCWSVAAHAFAPTTSSSYVHHLLAHAAHHVPSTLTRLQAETSSSSSSSSANTSSSSSKSVELFPVLKQIQGIDWIGNCRYVGSDLKPASFLLRGGIRYDLEKDDNDEENNTVKLTSFLTFPNGKARQVIMEGKRGSLERSSMRLDPTAEEGPIYMVLTEVAPDTILINEVDKASGKIVMTSSLSVVDGGKELVQVSHELGSNDVPVEGHQVWRLKKATWGSDDSDDGETASFRDATGR